MNASTSAIPELGLTSNFKDLKYFLKLHGYSRTLTQLVPPALVMVTLKTYVLSTLPVDGSTSVKVARADVNPAGANTLNETSDGVVVQESVTGPTAEVLRQLSTALLAPSVAETLASAVTSWPGFGLSGF